MAIVAPGTEAGQRATHQHVCGVEALRDGAEDKFLGGQRRQVLGRVHRQVCSPIKQGTLDFLDEDPLAPEGAERFVGSLIASGLDLDHLDLETWVRSSKRSRHPLRLGESQR